MKKNILILLCVLMPVFAGAQTSYTPSVSDLTADFGARISAGADKKLAKGLHLSLDGELRLKDNFSAIDRFQGELGLSYKLNPYLKMGAGYVFIGKYNSSNAFKPRHRFFLDASAGVRAGDWRFSLKECLQLTHRNPDDMNVYQANPNALSLKNRVKAEYKGFSSVSPYAFVEVRLALNDPACTASWNGTSFSDYSFTGYTDAYLNRVRGALGLEWKLSRKHSLDFTILGDYCYDKNIDTNAEGTKLKALSYDRAFNTSFCVGYKFSF